MEGYLDKSFNPREIYIREGIRAFNRTMILTHNTCVDL